MTEANKRRPRPFPRMAEVGAFHVGGATVELRGLPRRRLTVVPGSPDVLVDQDGEFAASHMYAQYMKLAAPRTPTPVVLWHGGGMTGAVWETTPDGRPGWQSAFLHHGFDVYLCDAVERGRAGWARYPEIEPSEPFFLSKRAAWSLFRIGPDLGYDARLEKRSPFPETLFPAGAFESFVKQIVPRWTGNEARVQAAYDALTEKVGRSILVAHSQGASFALSIAARHPERVAALVLLEPGGAPALGGADVDRLARVPLLILWGDRIDEIPFWTVARRSSFLLRDRLTASGGSVELIDLPSREARGNSHMLMMDTNSDLLADLVVRWIAKTGTDA